MESQLQNKELNKLLAAHTKLDRRIAEKRSRKAVPLALHITDPVQGLSVPSTLTTLAPGLQFGKKKYLQAANHVEPILTSTLTRLTPLANLSIEYPGFDVYYDIKKMSSSAAAASGSIAASGSGGVINPVDNPFGTKSPKDINIHLPEPSVHGDEEEEEEEAGEDEMKVLDPLLFPREFGAFASPSFKYEAPPALTAVQAEERILGNLDASVSVRYHPEVIANAVNDSIWSSTHITHAYARQVKNWGVIRNLYIFILSTV
ncbi:hypothetical protein WOLCODRAFT_147056 [Wolfiporia cocos MD-104 SS10]|uniref:Uncharacterized protein n=1 Tax=Wolfiporia cocos (strain MD-104) TaxID=742152 RepID=A0A2H3J2I0_WOLCO|nr:hypothetical protein WOLCODRAFT_147056 [Wolfiporia cocos MD-104 SS10]